MTRIPGIDTVRAVAALSVVLAHLAGPHMPGLLRYAFTGTPAVIAFFVVSGFCIHYPYRNSELPTVAFWSARLLRIMIPAVVALALAQMAGLTEYNFRDGYILWSIVCEMFYYAAYPLLLAVARRTGWQSLFAASFVVAYAIILSLGSDQYGSIHNYGWYLNWIVMLPAWLLGCMLADKIDHLEKLRGVRYWRLATALTASCLFWATMNTPLGFYLTLNIFAILVVFWLRAEISAAAADRPIAILEWVGTWSYSIYLMHIVVATFIASMFTRVTPVVLFSVIGSYVFYILVEQRAHKLARAIFRRLVDRSALQASADPTT